MCSVLAVIKKGSVSGLVISVSGLVISVDDPGVASSFRMDHTPV